MADASSQPKRQREETETSLDEDSHHYSLKHQKTHAQILSILDEDEEELNQEYLTDIFSTLQQEILEQNNNDVQENDQLGSCSSSSNEEEECNNDVMRHLLEASDDELGLPNMENDGNYYDSDNNVPLHVNVGLWEIEDEAANYYAILQSELFM